MAEKIHISTGNFYYGSKRLPSDIALETTGAGTLEDPYVVIQGGGGGGDSIYTTDGALTGDRTVDLDGNPISIEDGGEIVLGLGIAGSQMRAFDSQDDGNIATVLVSAQDELAFTKMEASFNDSVAEAKIEVSAGSSGSGIEHTADVHTFNGNIEYNGNAKLLADRTVDLDGNSLEIGGGGGTFLLLDPTLDGEMAEIGAYNPTDDSNKSFFRANTSNTQASFTVSAFFNDIEKIATITAHADATTATLEYTADMHTFNGNIINPELVAADYADDAAAAVGGIDVGGLYHTSGTVKVRLS